MGKIQLEYRFRNDDGNQTTATWMAAENTPVELETDTTYRLRINTTDDTGGDAWGSAATPFQYRLNGGTWTNITTSSSVVKTLATANIADNTATTEQLAGPNTFLAGRFDSNASWSVSNLVEEARDTELEFAFQVISTDVSPSDTIEFRLANLTTYTVTPSATVAGGATGNRRRRMLLGAA